MNMNKVLIKMRLSGFDKKRLRRRFVLCEWKTFTMYEQYLLKFQLNIME